MKNLFYWFILFFAIFACTDNQKESGLFSMESNYIINLDGKTEPQIPYSDYFKSQKTIILETNDDCLIGMPTTFQIYDGYIYILDHYYAKCLFVFDMEGRFIRKIGSVGNGPGEYTQPKDFTLDTANGFIFIASSGKLIYKYQLDGTFVQTITPNIERENLYNIHYYNGKLYLNVLTYQSTQDDFMLYEADVQTGKVLSKSIPLSYNMGWNVTELSHKRFLSRSNDPPRFTGHFMRHIVTIGEEITPYIELQSKNFPTAADIEKLKEAFYLSPSSYLDAIIEFPKIRDVSSFIENQDFIFFRYEHGTRNQNTVIYHKKTGMVTTTSFFKNDLIYKNNYTGFGNLREDFVFSDSKGAYVIRAENARKRLQEAILNHETAPELDKADELLQLDESANPVIFYYEFK